MALSGGGQIFPSERVEEELIEDFKRGWVERELPLGSKGMG